jgi:hypothetical protein
MGVVVVLLHVPWMSGSPQAVREGGAALLAGAAGRAGAWPAASVERSDVTAIAAASTPFNAVDLDVIFNVPSSNARFASHARANYLNV